MTTDSLLEAVLMPTTGDQLGVTLLLPLPQCKSFFFISKDACP
jgi:hypothetical protein